MKLGCCKYGAIKTLCEDQDLFNNLEGVIHNPKSPLWTLDNTEWLHWNYSHMKNCWCLHMYTNRENWSCKRNFPFQKCTIEQNIFEEIKFQGLPEICFKWKFSWTNFQGITSRLKYFWIVAKNFEDKYFRGWINILKILENFYLQKYVAYSNSYGEPMVLRPLLNFLN